MRGGSVDSCWLTHSGELRSWVGAKPYIKSQTEGSPMQGKTKECEEEMQSRTGTRRKSRKCKVGPSCNAV